MSTLETNSIAKYSGNNVSIDDSLNLKSYTTTQRDALTSAAGDMIYNSTTSKPQIYNGSAWENFGPAGFDIQYLIIAGGGSGGQGQAGGTSGGGGGAGGYRNSYASENTGGGGSTETVFRALKSTNYTITVGAGATAMPKQTAAYADHRDLYKTYSGGDSEFDRIVSYGGGQGGIWTNIGGVRGGSSGGSGKVGTTALQSSDAPMKPTQGYIGGSSNNSYNAGAGGGGAGGAGADMSSSAATGGNGGAGLSSSITGSAVTRASGGAGGGNSTRGTAATGGGGNGGQGNQAGYAGTVNTGGGGGGASWGSSPSDGAPGGAGGSGLVILRWTTADATIGATRTGLTDGGVQTDGSDSYIVFTAGTGTVSFS